jgi:hypothetical protein
MQRQCIKVLRAPKIAVRTRRLSITLAGVAIRAILAIEEASTGM